MAPAPGSNTIPGSQRPARRARERPVSANLRTLPAELQGTGHFGKLAFHPIDPLPPYARRRSERSRPSLVTQDRYRLNPLGRYSHERGYVLRTLALAGFEIRAIDSAELRMEGGKPVGGLVASAGKATLVVE